MTKIKFCGLSRRCDIEAVNELKPEYIGFVFVKTSKRYVSFEKAEELKSLLDPKIKAVGVFVNEDLKLRFFLAKASDVPTYVEYGAADIGIVGKDTILEEGRKLYEVLFSRSSKLFV